MSKNTKRIKDLEREVVLLKSQLKEKADRDKGLPVKETEKEWYSQMGDFSESDAYYYETPIAHIPVKDAVVLILEHLGLDLSQPKQPKRQKPRLVRKKCQRRTTK